MSQIYFAIVTNDLERLRPLVTPANVNEILPIVDKPALHIAAAMEVGSSRLEIVNFLIGLGANVNAHDSQRQTPLHHVLSVNVARRLIELGADINARDDENRTPLHKVVINCGNADVVKLLLDSGADINAISNDNETPLTMALSSFIHTFHDADRIRHENTIKLLLAHGARFDHPADPHSAAPFAPNISAANAVARAWTRRRHALPFFSTKNLQTVAATTFGPRMPASLAAAAWARRRAAVLTRAAHAAGGAGGAAAPAAPAAPATGSSATTPPAAPAPRKQRGGTRRRRISRRHDISRRRF